MTFTRKKALELLKKTTYLTTLPPDQTERTYQDELHFLHISEAYIAMKEFDNAIEILQMALVPRIREEISCAIIRGLSEDGRLDQALEFIDSLEEEEQPGPIAALIDTY